MVESQRVYLTRTEGTALAVTPKQKLFPVIQFRLSQIRLFIKLMEKPLVPFFFMIAVYWSSPGFHNDQNATPRKIGVCSFQSHALCQTCALDKSVFWWLKQLRTPTPFLIYMLPLSPVLLELIVEPCSKRAFGF